MNRIVLLGAALCLSAAAGLRPSALSAQGGGAGHGERGMKRGPDLFQGITLTPTQKQKIDSIHKKHMSERPSPDSMRAEMAALRKARAAHDTATVNRLHTAMHARQEAMNKELRDVLTPEQQVQFDKNVQKAEEKMKKKWEEHKRDTSARAY